MLYILARYKNTIICPDKDQKQEANYDFPDSFV